jgi:hypothetical protein
VLGGGAVAIRDLEPGSVAVGVPAAIIRRNATSVGNEAQTAQGGVDRRAGKVQATFIGPNDPLWRGVLARAARDIYHLPEYAAIVAKHAGEAQALAFYAEDADAACLIPLVRRPLPPRLEAPATWCDLVSPYGYPGPLFTHPGDTERTQRFWNAFIAKADELGSCSTFIRLHPLLNAEVRERSALSYCRSHGETVSIDLTRTKEEMWCQTRAGHQYDIRRLEKLKFTPVMDDWSLFGEFVRMYRETMVRIGADPYYHFTSEYFTDLKGALGEDLHLCCVLSPEGRPVAGGLFTGTGGIIQYHLSGSDVEFQRLAPTKSMLHFARLWGKEHGYSVLHLGGGLGSARDALFQFKAGFSCDFHEFRTFRIIVNEDRYRMLALRAGLPLDIGGNLRSLFFPPYLSNRQSDNEPC